MVCCLLWATPTQSRHATKRKTCSRLRTRLTGRPCDATALTPNFPSKRVGSLLNPLKFSLNTRQDRSAKAFKPWKTPKVMRLPSKRSKICNLSHFRLRLHRATRVLDRASESPFPCSTKTTRSPMSLSNASLQTVSGTKSQRTSARINGKHCLVPVVAPAKIRMLLSPSSKSKSTKGIPFSVQQTCN